MRQRIALWWFAVVPATLFGHVFAYALGGRTATDAHHAYLAPLLESSLVVLTAVVGASLASALVRARGLALELETRTSTLWTRLFPAQLALYLLLERAEGNGITLTGIAAQILAAFAAAVLLVAIVHVLDRCERAAEHAASFIARDRSVRPSHYVTRTSNAPAHALAIRAGVARFQRPPPTR